MATQVIFSFDSEDYITPEAADAEQWWAEMMTRAGVPACICAVGELARALRDRDRRDAVRAMARHEISYHSDLHSSHPTHSEYLENLSWDEGVAAVIEREASGIRDLSDLFGQWPASFCKPGYSWAPPVPEAMRRMGVPVLSDSPFEWSPGQPMWYANMLCLGYHCSFDSYFGTSGLPRLARMKADFRRRCAEFRGGTLVMYTHPCRLVTAEFWDGVNFAAGRNMPREHWRPARLRPEAEIAGLKRDFRAFVRWAANRRDVRITTYRQLHSQYRQPSATWIPLGELMRIAQEAGNPPEPVRVPGEWLSPAEIFALVARALVAFAETGALPRAVPVRRPLGPTEPLPSPSQPASLAASAVLAAARAADASVTAMGRLPARIPMGGAEVGPNSFLQAGRVLLDALRESSSPREVRIDPSGELPLLATRPDFARLHFRGTWSIFPPDFEAPRVAEMARWQAWTGKPALATRARPTGGGLPAGAARADSSV